MPFFGEGAVMNFIRQGLGLIWRRDQLVTKASTDTGQHSVETHETNIHAPGGFEPATPATAIGIFFLSPSEISTPLQ
jgi:hypothetical protein